VSLQPYYVSTLPGKLKIAQNSRPLTEVGSVERIVPNFRRKSFMFRSFFPYLLENSFSSLLTENILHSQAFYQKIIFKLNIVNFSM